MKILMMTNTYLPIVGGLEKSIQGFSEAFRARGHEVKIVAPEFENQPAQEKDVIRVPAFENMMGTEFSLTLPLPEIVRNLIKDFKPDIVHSHHPFLMGDLALRLCGQNKIPLVFTYHTMFEHYTDHFGMDKQAIQQFVIKLATGYANMTDQVIVPSESVGNVLKERKVKTPIAVVPTGIDVERFAPAPSKFREKNKISKEIFLAGHVGRLAPEKNLTFLTTAVASFLKKRKDAHFLIVGKGPLEKEMQMIFKNAGVQKRVHFTGVLKGNALTDAYHAMDAFVFASKSETQGIVVAEAMAAGLPVIGIDAPGVREVVKDKVNGRLLPTESQKEFSSALAWCASRSKTEWSELQKNALETATMYSSELCADRALRVYKSVVLRQDSYNNEECSRWQSILGRFKTEFSMFKNFGRAAGTALVKSAVPDVSPKEKVQKLFKKKIEETREAWSQSLEKLQKMMAEAPEASKAQYAVSTEALTQKIHALDSELAELNRTLLNACDSLEQFIADAPSKIEGEFVKVES